MPNQVPTGSAAILSQVGVTTISGSQSPVEIGKFLNVDSPAIAKLTNGDYIVAWDSPSPLGQSIAFQRFAADGHAITQVTFVPEPNGVAVAGTPSVMALPNGAFAIGSYLDAGSRNFSFATYSSENQLVSGRQYFGEPGWSYGHDNLAFANGYVAMASHSEAGGTGGYLDSGAWGGAWDVNFFIADTNGTVLFSGKAATNNANVQCNAEVIALADGKSFLVAWADQSHQLENSGFGLYGRVFSTTTMSFSTEPFLINQVTDGSQLGWGGETSGGLSLAAMPDGGFAAYWINDPQAGVYGATVTSGVIEGRIFSKVGSSYVAAANEFTVGGNISGNHNFVDVDQKPNGDMLSVFTVVDGAGAHLMGEVIGASGAVKVADFLISEAVDADSRPKVSWLDDGSAVVVWTQDDTSTATVGDRRVVSQKISAATLGTGGNHAPVITSNGGGASARLAMFENVKAVTAVTANDVDTGTTLRYAISGGVDAGLFKIDTVTGALSFKAAPDYESPNDVGHDNVYDVVVQVSDGSLSDTQALSVSVTDVVNETIVGTSRADVLTGAAGNDTLKGGAGNDTLYGNGGNDTLDGGVGADRMDGGTGNDIYIVDNTADVVIETASGGTDTVKASVSYALAANVENLALTGANNIGGRGNELANTIIGNSGANTLTGGDGNDVLKGGAGSDTLAGGAGKDVLTGGAGQDFFVFDTASVASSVDKIVDFNFGDNDKIQFSRSVFTGFTHTGSLTPDEFYAAAGATKAHDSSDRVIYDTASGKLYYDADGQGGLAAVLVAVLGSSSHPIMIHSDIQIIA